MKNEGVLPLKKGEKVAIDESGDLVLSIINNDFNSDVYLFCEKYFEMVSDIVDKTSCDIIGHFDLITKFDEKVRTPLRNVPPVK